MRKSFKVTFVVIILVLVLAYILGTYIARKEANATLKLITAELSKNPAIASFKYGQVSSDAIDMLQNSVSVNNVEITLTELPEHPIYIDQVTLKNYQENVQHIPTNFVFTLKRAHVQSFKKLIREMHQAIPQPHAGSPIIIHLQSQSQVSVYRGQTLLFKAVLPPGKQDIDTQSFPTGTYEVTIATTTATGQTDQHKQLFSKARKISTLSHLIEQLPDRPLIYATISAHYRADQHMIKLKLSADTEHQHVLDYRISLHPFHINKPLTHPRVFSKPLLQAYIESTHIKLHYQRALNDSSDSQIKPITYFMRLLQYPDLMLNLDLRGDYQSKQSQLAIKVALDGAAKLHVNFDSIPGKPRPVGVILGQFAAHQHLGPEYMPSLQAFTAKLQNQTLIQHLVTFFASQQQQTPQEITEFADQFLSKLAASTGAPRLKAAVLAIRTFIQTPKHITLALHPEQPMHLNEIEDFAAKQRQMRQTLEKKLIDQSADEQHALVVTYEQKRNRAISDFLDQIGFSVTAN